MLKFIKKKGDLFMPAKKQKKFFTYKDKPLVRCGNTLYYGDPAEKFVVKMDVRENHLNGDLKVADKISIQLISTNMDLGVKKQIVKTSEKEGLYLALDIADAWLERALTSDE